VDVVVVAAAASDDDYDDGDGDGMGWDGMAMAKAKVMVVLHRSHKTELYAFTQPQSSWTNNDPNVSLSLPRIPG